MLIFRMNAWTGLRTQSVPALERGLLILEFLAQSRRGVTLSQLTRKLQLPRSTGHALLLTYQRTGYVQRCEKTGRYCLGFRLQALANLALCGTSLRTQAAPYLRQLMVDTGLAVHLAVMEDGEAILIDRIEAPGTPHLATWVGKRMGLHCTALGKALISGQLCGCGNQQKTGFSDQQLLSASLDHRRALQATLASGAVLQMDQTALAHQGLLRHQRKRSQDTNLDRRFGLRSG